MFTIIPTKEESKLLNWLNKAATKDDSRPILTTFLVENSKMSACDGLRIHTIDTPECIKVQNLPLRTKIKPVAKKITPEIPNEIDISQWEADYPILESVMPKGKPTFVIGLNPQLLIDALSSFTPGQPVRLSFYTPTTPFIINSPEEDQPQTALVMPMYIAD